MAEPILDRERFVAQVTELQETLYRTARSILRNEQDAQDAVQEAVTQAFARLHTLRDPAKFKPWLLRILVNTCYDACRRRRSTVYLEAVEETLAAPQSDCEERMSLWSAVMRLPEEQKAVVTLSTTRTCPSAPSARSWASRRERSRRGSPGPGGA